MEGHDHLPWVTSNGRDWALWLPNARACFLSLGKAQEERASTGVGDLRQGLNAGKLEAIECTFLRDGETEVWRGQQLPKVKQSVDDQEEKPYFLLRGTTCRLGSDCWVTVWSCLATP